MSPLWGSVFKFDHDPGVSPPATKMLPLWGSFFVHNYMFRETIYSHVEQAPAERHFCSNKNGIRIKAPEERHFCSTKNGKRIKAPEERHFLQPHQDLCRLFQCFIRFGETKSQLPQISSTIEHRNRNCRNSTFLYQPCGKINIPLFAEV